MKQHGTFPFGQPILEVSQSDRTQRKVFVLGVYASAVHARWIGPDGKTRINAVGVASEPEIFWRGRNAEKIVSAIEIPHDAGRLVAASPHLNGPSGLALDDYFLTPLGLTRADAWLCDLVPHSCMNPGQRAALARAYETKAAAWGLPPVDWDEVPDVLADNKRRAEIESELAVAKPEVLITLGDLPLKWFTRSYGSLATLKGYGMDEAKYGQLHPVEINGHKLGLLPLVHPRQAARLGRHSARWASLHDYWRTRVASRLL